jgi:AAA domain
MRVPDGLSLNSDPAQVAEVERLLAAGGYSVVIADPLYKLHTGDSNDERAAVDLMRLFDGWRERFRFALVLPVHLRKPPIGAKFTMHEFFGSSAYLRGAEVVIGLQRVRDGYSRLHFFKDRDGDLPVGSSWGLLFSRDDGYRRDPEDGTAKQSAADEVRELLEAQPGMTIGQLVDATGKAERTIRKALKELDAHDERPGATADKLWSVEP